VHSGFTYRQVDERLSDDAGEAVESLSFQSTLAEATKVTLKGAVIYVRLISWPKAISRWLAQSVSISLNIIKRAAASTIRFVDPLRPQERRNKMNGAIM